MQTEKFNQQKKSDSAFTFFAPFFPLMRKDVKTAKDLFLGEKFL